MSLIKTTFSICVALLCLTSCSFVKQSSSFRPPHSGLFLIKQNGKMGCIDIAGKVVINPQFDYADEFYEDLAKVVIGGKFGFIDKGGKVVINPQFTDAAMFSEGLAFVEIDKKTGVIDKTGKFVINPQFDDYNYGENSQKFSGGIAPVRVGDKIGYIDTTGKFAVNPQFLRGNSFSEGLAQVMVGSRDEEGYTTEDSKCGYIDKTGKFVINPQFALCEDFTNGLAVVGQGTKKSFRNVAIDKTGKIVVQSSTFHVAGIYNDNLIPVCNEPYGVKRNCYYRDKTGEVSSVHSSIDGMADSFSEGLAAVTTADGSFGGRGKTGYIDTKGKLVINYQFYEARPFWGGLARVTLDNSNDGKFGYIDKTGKFVWNPTN